MSQDPSRRWRNATHHKLNFSLEVTSHAAFCVSEHESAIRWLQVENRSRHLTPPISEHYLHRSRNKATLLQVGLDRAINETSREWHSLAPLVPHVKQRERTTDNVQPLKFRGITIRRLKVTALTGCRRETSRKF
jgi:hypothetical protein